MVAPLLRARSANTGVGLADEGLALVSKWDVFRGSLEPFEHLRAGSEPGALPVSLVGKLYGEVLSTSVSRIEQFAMCPFRFFVHSGLRAGERVRYELDTRQQGSFQHEVLARFHEAVQRSGRRWRDLTVEEARGLMACTAETVMKEFEGGMLMATARNRFVARGYIEALQQFIGVVVGWMEQYRFDPARVELGFGLPGSGLPAWNLALGNGHALALRGRIDRVDIGSDSPGEGLTPCVVIDYKSRARQLDRVLAEHGIEMQLPAYLNVVRRLPGVRKELGVGALKPAGVFYVNLRGETRTRPIRDEALANLDDSRRVAYRHRGLFNLEQLRSLDNRSGVTTGDQIDYQLTRGGRLSKRSLSGMPAGEFEDFLDRQEALLIHFGKRIYLGEVAVDPYRKGQNTACKSCTYASICRIDPWVHVYRELKVPENEDGQEAEEEEA
jgi:ATP-dependent helicase/nuclease subunit B